MALPPWMRWGTGIHEDRTIKTAALHTVHHKVCLKDYISAATSAGIDSTSAAHGLLKIYFEAKIIKKKMKNVWIRAPACFLWLLLLLVSPVQLILS
mmetsp:Transcript_19493/g.54234  ORF Transcript_19493/g.54234 Transcript_19493/m.54234 type:complete len:96 (+) Transcript_19493:26-313(+)